MDDNLAVTRRLPIIVRVVRMPSSLPLTLRLADGRSKRHKTHRLDQAIGMFLAPSCVEEVSHALAMGNEPVGDV
jgi:hypothetical protein